MKIEVDINTAEIMRRRGLGGDHRAQIYLASEVARLSDPYIPFRQGTLKNQHQLASDGSSITYTVPYAHYQYYGQVMAGRAPKHYTGKALVYHGSMRGPRWDERMKADKIKELVDNLENYIKRMGG